MTLRFAAAALMLAAPAAAQNRDRSSVSGDQSSGFFFGAGLGSGWARVACDICRADRGTAVSGFIRLGGRVHSRLLVGAEANGWKRGDLAVHESMWGLGAAAYFYPNPRRGWYGKLGAGLMSFRSEDTQDVVSSTAFGVHLGGGYDLPVSGHVFLSPYASVFVASLGGKVKFNGAQIMDRANLNLVQLGIGVTRR